MEKKVLSVKQKKSILKLLDTNLHLKEILETIDVSYNSYLNTTKSDINFKKGVSLIRKKKNYLDDKVLPVLVDVM